jgi:(2R)-3-sulfolactate dehydrogenase (NADP+)
MHFTFEAAKNLAKTSLINGGLHSAAAAETANFLALAEADGIASHGLARVPQYLSHIQAGRVELKKSPDLAFYKSAAALVDACDGLAFPALRLAADASVHLANKNGISVVGIKNSHHFGVAGHFTEAVARAGFISLMFGNTPAAMPMVGGKQALFGTNPLSAAFPMDKGDPIVIDMSLSAVARGKLMIAAKKGEQIPLGWALTKDGEPTTNPEEGLQGLMVPLGGDKGALLALLVELLVVGLTGSRFSYEADSFFESQGNRPQIGQLIITIDPSLSGNGKYSSRLSDFMAKLFADKQTRLPGARRFALRELALKDGFTIPDNVVEQLQKFNATLQ